MFHETKRKALKLFDISACRTIVTQYLLCSMVTSVAHCMWKVGAKGGLQTDLEVPADRIDLSRKVKFFVFLNMKVEWF